MLHPIPKITGFYLFDSLVTGDWSRFRDASTHIILPAITLAAYPAALIARMTRAAMLDVLGQDYIRTARTFGLGERLVLWRLALRNAMPTTLTVSGLSLAYLITGTVRMASTRRDRPVRQAIRQWPCLLWRCWFSYVLFAAGSWRSPPSSISHTPR